MVIANDTKKKRVPAPGSPAASPRPTRRPASAVILLDLSEAERASWREDGSLTVDDALFECLRGLSRAESELYVTLHRRGLDNDDEAFLRYILLGDRIAAALLNR